jgi:hypothetical protein
MNDMINSLLIGLFKHYEFELTSSYKSWTAGHAISGKVVLVHEYEWIKGNIVNEFKITNHNASEFNHPICVPTDTLLFTILKIIKIMIYYGRRKPIDYHATRALIAACQGRKIVIPLEVLLCFDAECQLFMQWLDFSLILNSLQYKVINWIQPQTNKHTINKGVITGSTLTPTCKRRNSFSSSPADSPNNKRPCISY